MVMESNAYLNALKKQRGEMDKIHVAKSRSSEILEKQDKKCAKCHKSLRAPFYKLVGKEFICSDCLVQMAPRR